MRSRFFGVVAMATLCGFANAQVFFDQIPPSTSEGDTVWTSQDYEAAIDAKDVNYVDDFAADASQTQIGLVEAAMATRAGSFVDLWAQVTGFRVEIYSSLAAATGNLTGDVASVLVSSANATVTPLGAGWPTSSSIVSLPVNINLPSSGTYYVGVMGVLDGGANNDIVGVFNNTTNGGGGNGTMVNPGGGWGLGGNMMDTNADAGYRLTAVPEPASMIALGIGAAALLRRRRKQA